MNSKTNLLNATLAKILTFIQGKVAEGILTSDETTEIIEELQSRMKIPSQKKKNCRQRGNRGRSRRYTRLSGDLFIWTEKMMENPVVYR